MTPHMNASSRQKVEIVEALRGVAALSVAWFHFTHGNPHFLDDGYTKLTGEYGWVGVYIFFVISGFVIPYSLHRADYHVRSDYFRFLGKRLVRLEPPYLICIALTILLWYASYLTPGFRGSPPSWSTSQVLFHVAYLVPFFGETWLSPVFWSLAIEFQFYISVALMYPILASKSVLVRFGTLTVMVVLSYFFRDRIFLLSYLGLFAIGILVFHFHAMLVSATVFVASSAIAAFVVGLTHDPVIAGAALVTGLLIAFGRHVRVGPLVYLGTISYSLYLLHVPIGGRVINLGERFAVSGFGQAVTLAGAVALSILAAHVFYRVVERPSRAMSARIQYAERTHEDGSRRREDPVVPR